MEYPKFIKLVKEMREEQKKFFKLKRDANRPALDDLQKKIVLEKCKSLEKQVDYIIEMSSDGQQSDLF